MQGNYRILIFILLIVIYPVNFLNGQTVSKDLVEIVQPSTRLQIKLQKDRYSSSTGQQFSMIVENTTNKKMHITGSVVAIIAGGGEKVKNIDLVILPRVKVAGGDFFTDAVGLSGIVLSKECPSPQIVHPNPDNYQQTESNYITTLLLRQFNEEVLSMDEEINLPNTNKPISQIADNKDSGNKQTQVAAADLKVIQEPVTPPSSPRSWRNRTYLKLGFGLGYESIPVSKNLIDYSSESAKTNHSTLNVRLHFSTLNHYFVNFRLSPYFKYGDNLLSSDITGEHISYGVGGGLGFGRGFRVLVLGEYTKRKGQMQYDYPETPSSGLDIENYSDYNYSTFKYGVGAQLDDVLEVAVYRDNISFLNSIDANIYSYEAKLQFHPLWLVALQYSKNYPIAGRVDFKDNYAFSKQDYFSASIYFSLELFNTF